MPVDFDAVKKILDNSPSGYDFTSYKPKYGDNKDRPHYNNIKLLSFPPDPDKLSPLAKRVMKHYGLGADGKKQAICPRGFGIRNICPICEFIEVAAKGSDPILAKRVQGLSASERFLQLVIDWDNYELAEGTKDKKKVIVEVYDCPPRVNRDIMQKMATSRHDFTAMESALACLKCFNQGPGNPKSVGFEVASAEGLGPKTVKINWDEWKPLLPDLELVGKAPSPERLKALLEGGDDAPEDQQHGDPAKDPDWGTKEQQAPSELASNTNGAAEVKKEVVQQQAPAQEAPKGNSKLQEIIAKAKAGK